MIIAGVLKSMPSQQKPFTSHAREIPCADVYIKTDMYRVESNYANILFRLLVMKKNGGDKQYMFYFILI